MNKLICLDMDGVILKDINFWMELHKVFGTETEGKELNDKYFMTNYDQLVYEVITNLWKGKDATGYFKLIEKLEYLPGVKETIEILKEKNYIIAIITGSSIDVARRVQKETGIDFVFGNQLVIKDNKITGEYLWPIGHGEKKKAQIISLLCEYLDLKKDDVIFVGDNTNDIEAFKFVGKSIAFNSKSNMLNQIASHVVDSNDLRDILKFVD